MDYVSSKVWIVLSSGGTGQARLCAIMVGKNTRGRAEKPVKSEAVNDFATAELY